MSRTEVHKFGGTSVGDATRICAAAELLLNARQRCSPVAVVSAMTGVTDALVKASELAAAGRRDQALALIDQILERHLLALEQIAGPQQDAVRQSIIELTSGVAEVLQAVSHLRQLTPRSRDLVLSAGEKLSARLTAEALRKLGVSAVASDADGFLETDELFGEATPLPGIADKAICAALRPLLARGELPVVTGFLGRAPDGATTTLGRGGSDYSATLIAAALRADEVTIWTDVDGVYSASPRVVTDASIIHQLNFREAAELSFYGAKVLHQRTIIPVAGLGIPIRIRNSFAPEREGSWVDDRFTPGSHPVKAISAIHNQALVAIEGKGMAGVPGVAARVFGALASKGLSVTMISQSSSESSICLALPDALAEAAELALKREFRRDISAGVVDEVVVQRHVSLVAIVGLGMAQSPGVSARLFGALGARHVNVLAIAQGSSELNISLAVEQRQADDAVRAIHHAFGLHRTDTGEETTGRLDVLLFGFGSIGRALSTVIMQRRAQVKERFGLEPRIVGVCDRTGFLFRPQGISEAELTNAGALKKQGKPIAALPGAQASSDPHAMVRHALTFRLASPIVVDVSDAESSHAVMLDAFRLGCDVVTANKKPLAGSIESYRQLRAQASLLGRILRAEATVGAGLPVIDTLEVMLGAGDRLTLAQGCLSGTLAFVLSQLETGARFSDAVAQAMRLGYTEPDPMIDLCGADVARKAVILARISGLAADDVTVELTGLVDGSLVGLPADARLDVLEKLNEPMAQRIEKARAAGKVVRYVATVQPGVIRVGPEEVDPESALGMLRGTDNTIVFHTERYDVRPLVITGPGAGIDVTVMGVMGDILRVAAERRG